MTAGAVVFAGVALANLSNAGFNLIAGRSLGPGRYGDLAALLAVLGLVAFPLGAAQYNIASWVAALAARRDARGVAAIYRRSITVAFIVGISASAVLILLTIPIRRLLGVQSTAAVLLLAVAAFPAPFAPAILGLTQGLERFVLFAVAQAASPFVRFALLPIALAAGFGVSGAMGVTVVASFISVLVPAIVLKAWFMRDPGPSPITRRQAVRAISPVTIGIVSLTSLTSVDVVVAKIAFHANAAGIYGGASLIGRLILYVPASIASVLLPKVSSRAAVGRSSSDIVLKSLVATALLCVLATLVYVAVPRLLLVVAFGSKYTAAQSFLWLFGVAMTGYALVNVLFVYHIARGSTLVPLMLGAAALTQLVLFAAIHESPRALLIVSSAVAYGLLGALLVKTWWSSGPKVFSSFRE